jgi:hypothetical protein
VDIRCRTLGTHVSGGFRFEALSNVLVIGRGLRELDLLVDRHLMRFDRRGVRLGGRGRGTHGQRGYGSGQGVQDRRASHDLDPRVSPPFAADLTTRMECGREISQKNREVCLAAT